MFTMLCISAIDGGVGVGARSGTEEYPAERLVSVSRYAAVKLAGPKNPSGARAAGELHNLSSGPSCLFDSGCGLDAVAVFLEPCDLDASPAVS